MRRRGARAASPLRVTLLVAGLVGCAGVPARAACPTPRIDRLEPSGAPVPDGRVVTVEVIGCGFAPENVVSFGDQRFPGVPSRDGGRRLSFALPPTGRATGEAPPSPLGTGTYAIRVITPSGESNAVDFVVR